MLRRAFFPDTMNHKGGRRFFARGGPTALRASRQRTRGGRRRVHRSCRPLRERNGGGTGASFGVGGGAAIWAQVVSKWKTRNGTSTVSTAEVVPTVRKRREPERRAVEARRRGRRGVNFLGEGMEKRRGGKGRAGREKERGEGG